MIPKSLSRQLCANAVFAYLAAEHYRTRTHPLAAVFAVQLAHEYNPGWSLLALNTFRENFGLPPLDPDPERTPDGDRDRDDGPPP